MLDCAAPMTARILDGKSLAAATRSALKQKVEALVQRGVRPGLGVLIAGDNPASKVYVRNKTLAAEEIGVHSRLLEYGKDVSEAELMQTVSSAERRPGGAWDSGAAPAAEAHRRLERARIHRAGQGCRCASAAGA